MNTLLQNIMRMGGMTDQGIATDFLISAKSGVRNYAAAITEVATPELKAALREQLRTAIETHEKISNYLIANGYYNPHELSKQMEVNFTASDTAINLAQK